MIPYPVDEAHPSAVYHPTTIHRRFGATTTANHATRYAQGSLVHSFRPLALLVFSSGLSHVLVHRRSALSGLATPCISHVGHSVPKTTSKDRRRHF
jgi:hypothetical protein